MMPYRMNPWKDQRLDIGLCRLNPSLHSRLLIIQLAIAPTALILLLADNKAYQDVDALVLFREIGGWFSPPLWTDLQFWGVLVLTLNVWLVVGLRRARYGRGNMHTIRSACVYGASLYAAICATALAATITGRVSAGNNILFNAMISLMFLVAAREPLIKPAPPTFWCRWFHRHKTDP